MLIPKFWAEGRVQARTAQKQVTVRRFGWSDESQAAAQAIADARAREALARILSGETLPRRDLKRAYNGSEGVPIREEIVASYGDTVLTRNSYGAVCLNTPSVLFADIDFSEQPTGEILKPILIVLLTSALGLGGILRSWRVGALAVVAVLIAIYPIAALVQRMRIRRAGGSEQMARDRITAFLKTHSGWNLRLYRTPAGLRVMAVHDLFDPTSATVQECFEALGVDPIFARMCVRQQCFRARVSPKPWRISISRHLRPATVWPIDPARLPERQRWVEEYEQAAQKFAACKFIEALGSGVVHPAVADVQQIHDELCQVNRDIPIA
jgi:hypothetical protein